MNQRASSRQSITESIRARDFDAVSVAGSSAVPALLYTLHDSSVDNVVRVWAYQALRKLGKSAVPGLVRALRDPSAFVRRDAAHALERIKDRDATEALIRALDDGDANVRIRAVQALDQIPDDRAVEPLIRLLKDRKDVAHHATTALISIGISTTSPLMQMFADRRQDEVTRWRCAYVLGSMRAPEVLELLIRTLKDRDEAPYVRQGAAVGLSRFGGKDSIAPLIEALSDRDSAVRASAAHGLGEYARYTQEPDTKPVEPLIHVLREDSDPRARWMAALALPFFHDERAFPVLLSLRCIAATAIEEKRIKEAAGFGVRNMQRVEQRRAANVDTTQRDGNVP